MFGAQELVDRGMADRVGTLPQTLERFGASVHPVTSAASARRQLAEIRQGVEALSQMSNSFKVR